MLFHKTIRSAVLLINLTVLLSNRALLLRVPIIHWLERIAHRSHRAMHCFLLLPPWKLVSARNSAGDDIMQRGRCSVRSAWHHRRSQWSIIRICYANFERL